MSQRKNTAGHRMIHVSSAFKAWSIGKRKKPKSEILTIEQFEHRLKDGTL